MLPKLWDLNRSVAAETASRLPQWRRRSYLYEIWQVALIIGKGLHVASSPSPAGDHGCYTADLPCCTAQYSSSAVLSLKNGAALHISVETRRKGR